MCAAARTKNYSGAELEGVVKSAVSYALNRQLSMDDLTKPVDEESIKVTMDDFLNALQEIIPAFGASTDDLERCRYFFIVLYFILCFTQNQIAFEFVPMMLSLLVKTVLESLVVSQY